MKLDEVVQVSCDNCRLPILGLTYQIQGNGEKIHVCQSCHRFVILGLVAARTYPLTIQQIAGYVAEQTVLYSDEYIKNILHYWCNVLAREKPTAQQLYQVLEVLNIKSFGVYDFSYDTISVIIGEFQVDSKGFLSGLPKPEKKHLPYATEETYLEEEIKEDDNRTPDLTSKELDRRLALIQPVGTTEVLPDDVIAEDFL